MNTGELHPESVPETYIVEPSAWRMVALWLILTAVSVTALIALSSYLSGRL